MPKGRHRKQQLTQLPAGSRAMTGKSQSATKAQTYQRLLPVNVASDQSIQRGYSKGSPYTLPTWIDSLLTLCGFPSSSSSTAGVQKGDETHSVVGKWDPMSRSVYLDITVPSASSSKQSSGESSESSSMRYLWESGFFGKGTLSRSEPTWHKRQVNDIRVKRVRERGGKGK
jgi:hypothetical protein